jgi:DNA polymerase-3 subunit epsilon
LDDPVLDHPDDIPLSETTFVVVDLETTGGSPAGDRITEIGAVKVRGGEVLGDFATLVDPQRGIPPHIVRLTGITEAMVYRAPTIDEVLPAFLEFARDSVIVAHNARFDTGFLRAAATELGHPWPFRRVLCTVKLARRVLTRDEAPTVKLSALADLFAVQTRPTHRALDDARATVEVMHRLFERVGNLGINTFGDLRTFLPGVSRATRNKRTLADHLPTEPGVYMFRGPSDEVLYVGTATDLRRRVRSYFTGSETRTRIREMVELATRVDHVQCAHRIEAGVRELRLLGAYAPPYNRRSKFPHLGWWICLTQEAFPRLKVSRTPTATALGPFRSRATAYDTADLIADLCTLRTCRTTLRAAAHHTCEVGPDGRRVVGGCHAATAEPLGADDYRPRADMVAELFRGRSDAPVQLALEKLEMLAHAELFENAARLRDRLDQLVGHLERCQRLASLARISELVAAAPDGRGGWDLAVVRHGRLASAGVAARGVPPMPVVAAQAAAAETVMPEPGPLYGAPHEEVALVYRWLTGPGVRIVCATSGFSVPRHGGGRHLQWREKAGSARRTIALEGDLG